MQDLLKRGLRDDLLRNRSWRDRKIHLHDIEPKGAWFFAQLRQIGLDRASQDAFLALIDGMIAGHQGVGGASLYLDENEHIAIAADEIDFLAPIMRIAPVPRHDRELALPSQPIGRELLAVLARIAFTSRRKPR